MDNYKFESFQIDRLLSLDYDVLISVQLLQMLIYDPLIGLSKLCKLSYDSIRQKRKRLIARESAFEEHKGRGREDGRGGRMYLVLRS